MFDQSDVERNKSTVMVSAILQIFIPFLFFIPYVSNKESEYCRFYANQGLWLCIASVASWVVAVIPVIGAILAFVINVARLVFCIMTAIAANNGERKPIPYVGEQELLK